jgi:TonB family protein
MIKVSLIVLAGLAAVRMLKSHSAATRHWILAVTLGCAAVVPLVESYVPAWEIWRPAAPSTSTSAGVVVNEVTLTVASKPIESRESIASARPGWTLDWWHVRTVWWLGAALGLLSLAVGLARLQWLAWKARRLEDRRWIDSARTIAAEYGLSRPVALLHSTHPTMLVTWGAFRPCVLLPASAREWSDRRIRIVLSHELAHIRRGDWLPQLIGEALRCIYWFNPLLWVASRQLRQQSEHACDDAVLGLGVAGADYATHVLALARAASRHRRGGYSGFPAPAMAREGNLERRVRAMLDNHLNRRPVSRGARALSLAGLVAFTLLVSGFGARAQSFATISGSVTDPNGGLVPDVSISLTNVRDRSKHEVRTNASGVYEFVGLTAGEYELEAKMMGFRTVELPVAIVAGRNVRQDLNLKVGKLSETVTILAAAGTRTTAEPERAAGVLSVRRPALQCTPSSSGGEIKPPMKIKNVNPTYPDNPDASMQGVVLLEGKIGTDGRMNSVRVVKSPHEELSRAALDAIELWEFTPTLLNCVPIEVEMQATMNFRVEK